VCWRKPAPRRPRARLAARARAERAAPLALTVLMAALGCRHRAAPPSPAPPPPPVLGAISVELASPDEAAPPPLDPEAVRGEVRDRLLAAGLVLAARPDAGAAARADVDIRIIGETVEVGATGEARARVGLAISSHPPDAPGALSVALDGAGTQRYAARGRFGAGGAGAEGVETTLVARIAGELIDGFAARQRLHEGSPAAVHAALASDGGELREEAIRVAGERRLRDEAPRLLALLDDPDERTRDAALGALIAIGDRRAVSALTRSRSLRDRREMRKIIEAVSILGGQEADDYLSFVAASHDDDDIRAAAAAARERLLRREGAGGNPGR